MRLVPLVAAVVLARVGGTLERIAERIAKRILDDDAFATDGSVQYPFPCHQCDQRGMVGDDWCPRCGGHGTDWGDLTLRTIRRGLAETEGGGR